MTKPEILEKTPLTLAEVRASLKNVKKRDTELNFRANKTDEYVNAVTKLSQKQAADLKKALMALEIPRMKEEYVAKIVDTVPTGVAELKVILQGYTLTISNENYTKIAETINEAVQKK